MSKEIKHTEESSSLFGKANYQLILAGVVLIVIGFLLMMGGAGDGRFDPKEVYSFRRITLAPMVILLGLIIEIYAIMRKPKQ
jgi:fumarate reductase subunit D